MMRPSNEDKRAWCDAYGIDVEARWADWARQNLDMDVVVNPDKVADKFTFDLLYNGKPADLKSVRTPFYLAQQMFGLDPQYTVTFNDKDGKRYRELYPDITVIFDIFFDASTYGKPGEETIYIQPMHMVALGQLDGERGINRAIVDSGYHRHAYNARVFDTAGNAKTSWLLDARKLWVILDEDWR
jgi:hypothetical protein